MDNKKWYKRFGTLFWWLFTILPLLIALIQFVGFHLTFNSGISSGTDLALYHDNSSGDFYNILQTYLNHFSNLSIPVIDSAFSDFFDIFNVSNYLVLGSLFGFMASVQLYHLIYDIVVWLFLKLHCLLERSSH